MAAHECLFIVLIFLGSLPFTTLAIRKIYNVRVNAQAKPATYDNHLDWYAADFVRPDEVLHMYQQVYHGFSASLTPERVEELNTHAAVLEVSEDLAYQLHTTRSPEFIGLSKHDGLWSNTRYGRQMIIGIFDSGIWPEHPSFGDCKLGPVPSRWKGICQHGELFNESHCNNKLIGARHFTNGYNLLIQTNGSDYNSSRDVHGHGTHTASTAAGCFVKGASLNGSASAAGSAKGVAPKARLAVYKVCWDELCLGSDILAAFDSAAKDGVDVISMSLGSSARIPPYLDDIAIASFGAISKGISVVMSAGNAGPVSKSLAANAPWQFVVGSASIDRNFPAVVVLGDGINLTGASLYSGHLLQNQWSELVFPDIHDPFSNSSRCFDGYVHADMIRNKIVACFRGGSSRVSKGFVVRKQGGRGMFLINSMFDGEELVADDHILPTIAVGSRAGKIIRGYVKASVNATVKMRFLKTAINVKPAPVVSSFSSRGPHFFIPQILKPDIVAPGLNILAAYSLAASIADLDMDDRRSLFNFESGTSMSCPHVSGAVALLKAIRPTWSPAAIRSALMTTANVHDNEGHFIGDSFTGNAASPFALGSGNINLTSAMNPGLVYDITSSDYILLFCSLYGESTTHKMFGRHVKCSAKLLPENLNYPSFSAVFNTSKSYVRNQTVQKKFVRTVTNVGASDAVYAAKIVNPEGVFVKVDPPVLVFNRTTTEKTFVVTVRMNTTLLQAMDSSSHFLHGSLCWFLGTRTVRSPIVVMSWS